MKPNGQNIELGVLHNISQTKNNPTIKVDTIAFIPYWLGNHAFLDPYY
jgi:hypothetical protein